MKSILKEQHGHLLFTDGSSLGNPGPGGFGAVLVLSGGRVIEIVDGVLQLDEGVLLAFALARYVRHTPDREP